MSGYINTNFYNSYGMFGSSSANSSSSLQSLLQGSSSSNNLSTMLKYYGKNSAAGSGLATSAEVRTAGSELEKVISTLTTKGSKSLFNKFSAVSTEEKVAATSIDMTKVKDKEQLKPFELDVEQIAKAQVNSSNAVKSAERAVSSGIHNFTIQNGSKEESFSINVSVTDNNESIQKKMVEAINSKKMGVTASINYESGTKSSQLTITAATTGNKNTDGSNVFTIEDSSGNLAEKMGILKTSTKAQNAIYSINDQGKQTSTTNKIDFGNGVSGTLKSAGSTKVEFKNSDTEAATQARELVTALNSALTAGADSDSRGAVRLFSDVFTMNKAYSSSLARVGINVGDNGLLTINEDKLNAASTNGSLKKMFQDNSDFGFAARVNRISDNMNKGSFYADPVAKTPDYSSMFRGSNYGSLYDSLF